MPWQLYYVQICFSTFPQVVSTAHNPLWLYVRVYPVEYSATGLHLHQPHPDKYGITPPLCVPVHPLPHDKTSRCGWKYQLLPDTRPVFLPVLLLPGCPDPHPASRIFWKMFRHQTFATFPRFVLHREVLPAQHSIHSSCSVLPRFHTILHPVHIY